MCSSTRKGRNNHANTIYATFFIEKGSQHQTLILSQTRWFHKALHSKLLLVFRRTLGQKTFFHMCLTENQTKHK